MLLIINNLKTKINLKILPDRDKNLDINQIVVHKIWVQANRIWCWLITYLYHENIIMEIKKCFIPNARIEYFNIKISIVNLWNFIFSRPKTRFIRRCYEKIYKIFIYFIYTLFIQIKYLFINKFYTIIANLK